MATPNLNFEISLKILIFYTKITIIFIFIYIKVTIILYFWN